MTSLPCFAVAVLLAALPSSADAAELTGQRTSGGRAFRITTTGALTDSALTIAGARAHTSDRVRTVPLERAEPRP